MRLRHWLHQPVDAASLAVFRMAFGGLMAWDVWRYVSLGRIESYYLEPRFLFTYPGFEWVQPWPGFGLHLLFLALVALAICIAFGYRTRLASALFVIGFAYVFLLDQPHYLNHFYLIILLAGLLAVVDAGRLWSIDAWLDPRKHSDTAPRWMLWTILLQLVIVYVYAGVAKLNWDWLRGEPLTTWLSDRTDFPIIGSSFTNPGVGLAASYGILLLDLFLAPLLLWRRTRIVAFCLAIAFHAFNVRLFSIGVFPWMMMAATTLFLDPSWPRRLLGLPKAAASPTHACTIPMGIATFLTAHFALQLLIPLRHFAYPGNVSWTEEGHRFAWHMKLRSKDGDASFVVVETGTGRRFAVDLDAHLTEKQQDEMSGRPQMLRQFAAHLADLYREIGIREPKVFVDTSVSLNGRTPQPLVDPTLDMAAQPLSLFPSSWILPLHDDHSSSSSSSS